MIDYDPRHWRYHFLDVRGSMLREILYRVTFCFAMSLIAVALAHFGYALHLSDKPHLYIGGALSLLLVFRTNSANDRYWEGRRLWGAIVNSSRNLGRKARALLGQEPALVESLSEWTIAYAWATSAHLRDRRSLGPEPRLPAPAQEAVLASSHVPVAVAAQLSVLITDAHRRGRLTDIQQYALDNDVQALIDHLGGCERIAKTPLPFAYVVHLRRALLLYCSTLPFVLLEAYGLFTPLVSLALFYVLFGIEEIGAEIERPFGEDPNDLPLDRICAGIQATLRAPGAP